MLFSRLLPIFENKKEPCKSITMKIGAVYRVIQNDGLNRIVNGASTHARQLVAVFQVLCSLYGLTCVGYAQNSLEFVSRSPLKHAKNFVLPTSHFALN